MHREFARTLLRDAAMLRDRGCARVAPARSAAEELTFDLKIEKGRWRRTCGSIRVKQGDVVKLRWTTRPADRAAPARLRHREEGGAGRGRGDGFHGPRDGTVPGRGAQARTPRAATRMVRLRLSASRSVRASAVAWVLAAAACGCRHAGGGARLRPALRAAAAARRSISFGAAAAVALSFVVFGLFVRRAPAPRTRPQIDLLATPLGRIVGHPAVVLTLRLAVLGLFVVTVLAGLIGDQNPYRNIAPTLVWIVWWVGLAYVSAFAGDLWALVNPWRDRLRRRAMALPAARAVAASWRLGLPYPAALGVWPACLLLLAFSWTELVYPNAAVAGAHRRPGASPIPLLTWAGMLAYGRDTWLRHGEVFSLVFATFARFAPTEATGGRLLLRPFGRGPARGRARLDVDDGVRAAAAGDRSLRRAHRHRRMGVARRRPARALAGSWRARRHADQERRPRRVLAPVPRRLSRHLAPS